MFWNGAHSVKVSQRICKTMNDLLFVHIKQCGIYSLNLNPQYLLFYDKRFDSHKITYLAEYWLPLKTKYIKKTKKNKVSLPSYSRITNHDNDRHNGFKTNNHGHVPHH